MLRRERTRQGTVALREMEGLGIKEEDGENEQISMEMKRNGWSDRMQRRESESQLKKSKAKVWPRIGVRDREGQRCAVHAWGMLIMEF